MTRKAMPSKSIENQLWAWKDLTANLEKKIVSKEDEIGRLKEKLGRRDREYAKLQEEFEKSSVRISSLESQSKEKSQRIIQLAETTEKKRFDEMWEKLKEKTLQSVEVSGKNDLLKANLEKSELEIRRIQRQCESLDQENIHLSERLDQSSASLDKMQQERSKNNKLLRELSDIVRCLNCVTINYEKEAVEVVESTAPAHEQAIKNVKRKIEAMEDHRNRLTSECQQLREENVAKDAKISALESYFHSVNEPSIGSDETDKTCPSHSARSSDETVEKIESHIAKRTIAKAKAGSSHSYKSGRMDEDDAASSTSSVSSFSTLDPPEVPLENFESMKKDYEEALEKILSLSESLGEVTLKARALEQAATDQRDHISRCEYLENENKEIQHQATNLETKLGEARSTVEALQREKREAELRYLAQIAEADQAYECVKQQLDSAKAEFSAELDYIEAEVESSTEVFNRQRENLKKSHAKELETLVQEYTEFKTKHSLVMDTQKKRYDDMNLEYETFMEIHTNLEGEFESLQNKYDESLRKIVSLEDKLETVRKDSAEAQIDLKKALHANSKSGSEIAEIRLVAEKSRAAMQEAVLQYEKLRRESQTTISKYQEELKQLRQEKVLPVQSTTNEKAFVDDKQYFQLQRSYESALMQIETLGAWLSDAGIKIDMPEHSIIQDHQGWPSIRKQTVPLSEISTTEQLPKTTEATTSTISQSARRVVLPPDANFTRDFMVRISNGEAARSNFIDQNEYDHSSNDNCKKMSKGEKNQDMWHYRLFHHVRLRHVHDSLHEAKRPVGLGDGYPALSASRENEALWPSFVDHFMRLKLVHEALRAFVTSRLTFQAEESVESAAPVIFPDSSSTTGLWQAISKDFAKRRRLHCEIIESGSRREAFAHNTQIALDEEHTLKSVKAQVKRFQEVQKELLRTGEHPISARITTSKQAFNGDHFDSFVPIYHVLRHHARLHIVHYDLINKMESYDGICIFNLDGLPDCVSSTGFSYSQASDFQSKGAGEGQTEKRFISEDESLGTFKTARKAATARLVIDGLRLELRRVKLAANAARIRHRAREKELRVVHFQYEKLQQEYDTKVSSSSLVPDLKYSSTLPAKYQRDSGKTDPGRDKPELLDSAPSAAVGTSNLIDWAPPIQKSLSEDLREAEQKVQQTTRALQLTKEDADEAAKKQEIQEKHLQNVIAQFQRLEDSESSISSSRIQSHKSNTTLSICSERMLPFLAKSSNNCVTVDETKQAIFRQSFDNTRDIGSCSGSTASGEMHRNSAFQGMESFDGSHLTSVYEPTMSPAGQSGLLRSPEARDEKVVTTQLHFEDATYILEHDAALKKITEMGKELNEAKGEAKRAKKKYEARERDLRDVIFQYKQLQSEFDCATEQYKQGVRGNDSEHHNGLMNELISAKSSISVLQADLASAKEAASSARRRLKTSEGHLRQVIDEYKKLQGEHSSVLRSLDNLKRDLAAREGPRRADADDSLPSKINLSSVEHFLRGGKKKSHSGSKNHSPFRTKYDDDARSVSSQKSKSSIFGKKLLRLGLGRRSTPNSPRSPSSPTKLKVN